MTTVSDERSVFNRRLTRGDGTAPAPARNSKSNTVFLIFERAFLIFAVISTCGVTTFGAAHSSGDPSSNPVNLAFNVVILTIISLLLMTKTREAFTLLPYSRTVIAFTVLAFMSTFWSHVPGVTFRHVGAMILTMLVPLYMVIRFDMHKCIVILGQAFLIVLIASILVCLLLPQYGLETVSSQGLDSANIGDWKGLMPVKNNFGWLTFGGVQVYAWRFLVEPTKRRYHGAIVLLFILTSFKINSATAQVAIMVSIGTLAFVQLRRWDSSYRLLAEGAFIVCFLAVTVVLPLWYSDFVHSLGKDVTLTGRVPLWHASFAKIQEHPILGYGYYGFWVATNPDYQWVVDVIQWDAPDAHNAYIDLALELGIPGAVLGTLPLIAVVSGSWKLSRDGSMPWAQYVAMFSIVFAITNLVDTRLFRSGDNFCLILCLCYFRLAKHYSVDRVAAGVKARLSRSMRAIRTPDPAPVAEGSDALVPVEPAPVSGPTPVSGLRFRSITPRS